MLRPVAVLSVLTYLSAAAFLLYGSLCLFTNHMKSEFGRYGLSRYRRLVGLLEILGGCGLLLGTVTPLFHFVSAAGLSLLMLLGLLARWKVRDAPALLLPAALLLAVNMWIFWARLPPFS
jgi:hypothetical protein